METTSKNVGIVKSRKKIFKWLWILSCVNTIILICAIGLFSAAFYVSNNETSKQFNKIIQQAKYTPSTSQPQQTTEQEPATQVAKPKLGKKSAEELNNEALARLRKEGYKIYEPCYSPLDKKWMKSYRVSSPQGMRSKFTTSDGKTTSGKYHNALDVVVPEGTAVYSIKSGEVITVWPSYYNGGAKYKGDPIYGGMIEVRHNDGSKSMYAHLSLTLVHEGDIVEGGQLIGRSGGIAGKRGSGTSTGEHLHFEIIDDLDSYFFQSCILTETTNEKETVE